MPKVKTKEAEVEVDNRGRGAEKDDRFPDDTALRKVGFRINARPKGKKPVWELAGDLFDESEALRSLIPVEENDAPPCLGSLEASQAG